MSPCYSVYSQRILVILLCAFGFFMSQAGFGQSMEKRYQAAVDDYYNFQYTRAIAGFEQCKTHYQQVGNTGRTLKSFYYLCMSHFELGNTSQAIDHLFDGADLAIESFGDGTAEAADFYVGYGKFYHQKERYDSARIFYRAALALKDARAEPLIYGEAYANMGYACDYGGAYDSALYFYQKSIEFLEPALGTYHPYVDWVYASMPFVASHSGQHEEQIAAAQKSLKIKTRLWGTGTQDHLDALKALAVAYEQAGDAVNQGQYFEQALELTEKLHGTKSTEYATILSQLGNAYAALHQTDKAASFNKEAYELRKNLLGEKHEATLDLLRNVGNVYYDGGRYQLAMEYYEQSLKTHQKAFGKNDSRLIRPLEDMAQVHENLGNFQQAEGYYQRALTLKQQHAPELLPATYMALARISDSRSEYDQSLKHLDAALLANLNYNGGDLATEAFVKNNMGTVYRQIGEYAQAQEYLLQSLEIRQRVFGEVSREVAQTLANLGNLYLTQGQFAKALETQTQVLRIEEIQYGESHPRVASTLVNLANVYAALGHYQKEIDLLKRAEEIQIAASGSEHVELISIYNNMAIAYANRVQYEKALNYTEKHRELSSKLYGEQSESMADHYNVLGMIRHGMGETNTAFDWYEKAADVLINIYPEGNEDLATVYNNLGVAYLDYQEYGQAEQYLNESLRLYRKFLHESHPDIITTTMNLGLVAYGKSNYPKAIEIFQNTLKMGQQHQSLDSLTLATVHQNLGVSYTMLGDQPGALAANETALKIRKEVLGRENILVADMQINIGNILTKLGRLKEAEEYFRDTEKIYEQPGILVSSGSVTRLYLSLSDLYAEQGDFSRALDYSDKAIATNQTKDGAIANQVLYFVAQVQKVDYAYSLFLDSNDQKYLDQSSALITQANEVLKLAEREILNDEDRIEFGIWKTLLTNIGIKNALAQHEWTGDTQYLEEAFYYAERSKANVLISALNESRVKTYAGVSRDLISREQDLSTTIQRKEEQLFKLTGNSSKAEDRENLEAHLFALRRAYDEVTKKLRSNTRYQQLVNDFELVTVKDVREQLLTDNEAILELAMSDSTLHVFLITKEDIKVFSKPYSDRAGQMITALRNAIIFKSQGAFQYASNQLYQLTLSDVEQYLQSSGQEISILTIVPEGPFNYFPFEALQRDGKYLIEDYQVQYAYSLTLSQMLRQKPSEPPNNSLLAFAPVFSDPSINTLTQGAREVFMAARSVSTEEVRGFSINGEFITPLPGTKEEVDAIDQLLDAQGYASETLIYDQAKEEVIKSGVLNDYQYIHLATHGFVNEGTPAYSGVFLSQDQNSDEDCILFASEIYGLEMQADLVTLSACETGLGRFAQGEGIVGLSRAFLYAGAKNLLVSQWKVSDESTARLMVDFYRNVLNGESKSASLREAKLALINDEQFHQPYFWAPFVLIGE